MVMEIRLMDRYGHFSGAARNGNGNDSDQFGNIGDWSVDLVVSEKTGEQAATDFGAFKDNQHSSPFGDGTVWPLYQGADVLTQTHGGHGCIWLGFFCCKCL